MSPRLSNSLLSAGRGAEHTLQTEKHAARETLAVAFLVFDAIASSLETDRRVELRGFGSFGLKERGKHAGRNPKTGESVAVKAKRVVFFKTGKALRERVDHGVIGTRSQFPGSLPMDGNKS